MPLAVLVNGSGSGCIAAGDRGLLYGDGVFETMAVRGGRIVSWARHVSRLLAGCTRLGIPAPAPGLLAGEAQRLLAGRQRAVLKLIVTRGPGGRGYREPETPSPTRILQLHPWPDLPADAAADGVAVRVCATRLCHNPALAGIKHLNRLEQVMASRERHGPGIREGLLLDADGLPVEGIASNLFIVRRGGLLTPDLQRCGVAGIMRSLLIDLARQQSLGMEIRPLAADELREADEVFLCNALIGIWPVVAVDGRPYRKGAVTARLQRLLETHEDEGGNWYS